jgi:hypothetical protein
MSKSLRQLHRWVSLVFTLAVIINIVAMALGSQAVWVGFLALVPAIFLICTGLYLFVLPYTAKGRRTAVAD